MYFDGQGLFNIKAINFFCEVNKDFTLKEQSSGVLCGAECGQGQSQDAQELEERIKRCLRMYIKSPRRPWFLQKRH